MACSRALATPPLQYASTMKDQMTKLVPASSLLLILMSLLLGSSLSATAANPHDDEVGPVEVSYAVYSDVSWPLRDVIGYSPAASTDKEKKERPLRVLPNMGNALDQIDGALQTASGPSAGTTSGLNFAGVGQGDYGFSDRYAPPDSVGAVGATQYV